MAGRAEHHIAAGTQTTEALAAAVDADQLGELAKSAGLQVSSVTPAGSRSIIELRPSH